MPHHCVSCVPQLRAKEETLWLGKLAKSSHEATADGSSGVYLDRDHETKKRSGRRGLVAVERSMSKRTKRFDGVDHFDQDANEFVAFAGGDVIEAAACFLDTKLLKQPQQDPMTLDRPVIARFVVTVAGMAREDEDAIGSSAERLHDELRIDAAAAHHTDHADVGRVGRLRGTRLVSPGVRTPVAQKTA